MCEGMVFPVVLFGCKAWALDKERWNRVEELQMECLRTIRNDREREVVRGVCMRDEEVVLK